MPSVRNVRPTLDERLIEQDLLPAQSGGRRDIRGMSKRGDAEKLAAAWQAVKREKHVPRRLAEQLIAEHAVAATPRIVELASKLEQLSLGGPPARRAAHLLFLGCRDLVQTEPEIDLQMIVVPRGVRRFVIDHGRVKLVLAGH